MDAHDLIHQNILDNMDNGVVAVDFAGKVILFNAAAGRILGEPEDLTDQTFADAFLIQEGLDAFTQTVLDSVSSETGRERQVISIEVAGNRRLLGIITTVLRSGRDEEAAPIGIIAVFTDISATEALRESELKLGKQVKTQYDELQGAYRQIEDNNSKLAAALRRVRVVQGVAAASVLLVFGLIGAFVWNPGISDDGFELEESALVLDEDGARVMKVQPQRLLNIVTITGTLAPRRSFSVLSPIEATVTELHFEYGDQVEAGQVLATLDLTKVQQEHRALRALYIDSVKKVRELADWENSREFAAARRSLTRARNSLEKQKHKLQETAFLLERGVIPAAEHQAAEEQHENLQSDYEVALQEVEAVREQGGPEAQEVAQLAFENLKEQLGELEAAIADANVRAPGAGVVMRPPPTLSANADGPLVEGKALSRGGLLVTIADVSAMSVSGTVDETEITQLALGQPVTVTTDAVPGVELSGAVTNVSSQALAQRGGAAARFEVTVGLDPLTDAQRRQLRLGMSADVRITIRDQADALLVPISAVRAAGGGTVVQVRNPRSGEFRPVEVETGLTTLDAVEIVQGLKAGDEILVAGGAPAG